ncbi:MAG: GrpB family protein [Actinobacteria bacterium]|nr:GrpB family protein [Actinomycetota bacterium]
MLSDYDPDWPRAFEVAAAELRNHGREAWPVEHIGSTSVPGLVAKPVIDLAVRVEDVTDLDGRSAALEDAGWLSLAAGPTTHAVRVKQSGSGQRTHIAHFFREEQWERCHQRLFAAWLREHPEDRDRYARLKQALASSGLVGREYTEAKTTLVQEIVDCAANARGLPPIAVRDKASG